MNVMAISKWSINFSEIPFIYSFVSLWSNFSSFYLLVLIGAVLGYKYFQAKIAEIQEKEAEASIAFAR